jgi:hypothetical protein
MVARRIENATEKVEGVYWNGTKHVLSIANVGVERREQAHSKLALFRSELIGDQ